jgi:uncharacterized repeat protein (TIGR03803 family)
MILTTALAILLASGASAGTKYKILHNFGVGKDGPGIPSGSLLLGRAGNLYGNTYSVTFGLTPQANGKWKEAILHSFATRDGAPWGALISGRAGKLYGTTVGGPTSNSGVFELSPGTQGWSFGALYTDGAGPGLLMDKAGNLYGDIGPGDYFGIGAIGELSHGAGGWTYTDLFNFNPTVGYAPPAPPAPPIWDGQGNLYGSTSMGGIRQPACWTGEGCGLIFKMMPKHDGTWTYHVLHRFASSRNDGQTPNGGLAMDASGNLYGVTVYGGVYNQGRVFKLTFSGGRWKETALYDFPNCADGCLPAGTPAFDQAGNLYATASGGLADCGGYTCGVVFKLKPQQNGKWKYSVVYKLRGSDGSGLPYGVIVDGNGNLFGTTSSGGTYNAGVAFEITP